MRYRLVMLAMVFAAIAPLTAQTTSGSDKISGVWSGYIGRSEATPAAAKMELKLGNSGKLSGTVTGPELTPGDISSGTYDAATGAIKFTVQIRKTDSDKGGQVTLDGRVSNDTAAGALLMGDQRGVFRFVKGAYSVSVKSSKPPIAAAEASAAAKRGFVEVSGWIARAADMVPSDKYSYRPTASVRTFGQIIAHVADGSNFYCGRATRDNVQWSDNTEKTVTSKAAIVEALTQALAKCGAVYDKDGGIAPLMENIGHSSLHYGNIVTYMRMMGMTPPSS